MWDKFSECEICGNNEWKIIYQGDIRDGKFGNVKTDAIIAECSECGIERLNEESCPEQHIYETDEYRNKLQQGLTTGEYYKNEDHLQKFVFELLNPNVLRNNTIADVGCAGGSFLDHVAGIAAKKVAIEPCNIYRSSLIERGYEVYSNLDEAKKEYEKKIDYIFCFQVIEHVSNPREFLEDIFSLLKEGGKLLISTPNREDILMHLLPDIFPAFFYRVVHRWYFDINSLSRCAVKSGFNIEEFKYIHRYGISNTLAWLRDNKPTGHDVLPGINSLADHFWKAYLEDSGQADCLFMLLKK